MNVITETTTWDDDIAKSTVDIKGIGKSGSENILGTGILFDIFSSITFK